MSNNLCSTCHLSLDDVEHSSCNNNINYTVSPDYELIGKCPQCNNLVYNQPTNNNKPCCSVSCWFDYNVQQMEKEKKINRDYKIAKKLHKDGIYQHNIINCKRQKKN